MATVNSFDITNKGFFCINDKIIGSRVFSQDLITPVGNPIVSQGVARSFSEDDYFVYSPLDFEETTKITITFDGQFFLADHKQCMFELSGDGLPVKLSFTNDEVLLTIGNYNVIRLRKMPFTDNTRVSGNITFNELSWSFTLRYGTKTTQKSGIFIDPLDMSYFNSVTIGTSPENRTDFWDGYFNLTEFSIYKNDELMYTPSEGAAWTFTKILVSDGEFPLTDKSVSIAKHIYEFPVKEINRSGNTVLITAEITEKAYLVIKEIGLYISSNRGTFLFGSVDQLNIRKSKELSYDLIFTVNTTLHVVNAIGFPAEDGIVVDDPEFVRLSDYGTIEEVNLYVLTNLERIIGINAMEKYNLYVLPEARYITNKNATGLGYNRAENVYQLQRARS